MNNFYTGAWKGFLRYILIWKLSASYFVNSSNWMGESESEVAQSCPTLCDPMDCSPPGSSVHGILQARVLKWVAVSFSRGSSQPRDQTQVSCIAGRFFTHWAGPQNVHSSSAHQSGLGMSPSSLSCNFPGRRIRRPVFLSPRCSEESVGYWAKL